MNENWIALKLDNIDTTAGFVAAVNATLARTVGDGIRVDAIILPGKEEARIAWEENLDLYGRIRFSGKFNGGIALPLPYEGIFLSSNPNGMHPHRMVWSSWLGERPGLWMMRKPSEDESQNGQMQPDGVERVWRLGLANGDYIGLPIGEDSYRRKDGGANERKRHYLDVYEKQYELLKKSISELDFTLKDYPDAYGKGGERISKWVDGKGLTEDSISEIHEEILELAKEVRYDDLAHRQLMTFPVWLKHKLCRRIYDLRGAFESIDFPRKLAFGLVPLAGRGALGPNAGGMSYADPENALDLISKITGVKRCWINRTRAESIPQAYRQNDVSFDGCICPIESPESEMVGLQLQLACGAVVRSDGSIVSGALRGRAENDGRIAIQNRVGWGVAMIPFANHNDGARNMMGAKNLRQAVPVCEPEVPLVESGIEKRLLDLASGAMELGMCPESGEKGRLKIGCNLLVAYLPWYGLNVDDAVVVSETICQKMAVVERIRFSEFVAKGWKIAPEPSHLLEPDAGIATVGTKLSRGSLIVRLRSPSGRYRTIRYSDCAEATLTKISFNPREGFASRLEYEIERRIPLGVGDKLMGRHGNKGVVSKVLPVDEMPKINGRPVDVLLNPHGVLSRMNPSQLLETHLGWLFEHGVKPKDVLRADKSDCAVGSINCEVLDHDKIQQLLEQHGLDALGKGVLQWRKKDGNQLYDVESKRSVAVGYQYFVRLHHIPELKSQVRRGGTEFGYSLKTGQPVRGRKRGGGQRVGEMEFWALEAYGARHIIDEMVRRQSGQRDYETVLSDWLKALLVKTEVEGDKVVFSSLTFDSENPLREDVDRVIRDIAGEPDEDSMRRHAVTVPETQQPAEDSTFMCAACGAPYMNGRRFRLPGKRSAKRLTLGNLLDGLGYASEGVLEHGKDGGYTIDIAGAGYEANATVEFPDFDGAQQRLRAKVCLVREGCDALEVTCQQRYEANKTEIAALGLGGRKPKLSSDVILRMLLDRGSRVRLTDFNVTCPDNPTEELISADDCEELDPVPAIGGLYDPKIFGEREDVLSGRAQKWGYIELPVAIPLRGTKNRWMKIIPVLPLCYRATMGVRDPSPIDRAYQEVLRACKKINEVSAPDRGPTIKVLSRDLQVLFDKLHEKFSGKRGLLRHDGLGRRVDHSCRLVIVPDPELKLNECGVPADVLWELASDDKECPTLPTLDVGIKNGDLLAGWTWGRTVRSAQPPEDLQYEELKKFFSNGRRRIVLNRQPSLHKYSMQAFVPYPVKPQNGIAEQVFHIPPLCCKGFAADFDGDEMVGYYLETPSAQDDCLRMSPDKNLKSEADGNPLVNFDRDFVTGLWLLYGESKEMGENRIRRLCSEEGAAESIQRLATEAFRKCTEEGISFGFYDLREASTELNVGSVNDIVQSGANGKKQWEQNFRQDVSHDYKKDGSGNLLEGMTWQQMFDSSWNARKSMCAKKLGTGLAGDLTRKLVFAMRGKRNGEGKAVGLVAAQSIGERGTQLSMKAAHTSGKDTINIGRARDLMLRQQEKIGEFERWYGELCKEGSAYCGLGKEHFKILWEIMNDGAKGVEDVLKGLKGLDRLAFSNQKSFVLDIHKKVIDNDSISKSSVGHMFFSNRIQKENRL